MSGLSDVRQNNNAKDAIGDVMGISAVKNVSDTGDAVQFCFIGLRTRLGRSLRV